MNRKRVFKHTKHDRFTLKTQIILYASLAVFNLFMTSFLVQIFVASGFVSIAVAKIIVTVLIAIWNFVIFKLFIFSKKDHGIENNLDERTLGGVL
jgi:putative flippase GtrA